MAERVADWSQVPCLELEQGWGGLGFLSPIPRVYLSLSPIGEVYKQASLSFLYSCPGAAGCCNCELSMGNFATGLYMLST